MWDLVKQKFMAWLLWDLSGNKNELDRLPMRLVKCLVLALASKA